MRTRVNPQYRICMPLVKEKSTENFHKKSSLNIERIQGLTDGTFAVAMTILVLEIRLPQYLNRTSLLEFFSTDILHGLMVYFMSFIVLGIFWIGSLFHHHLIAKTDRISSWLNILFLMFICLIPFSAGFLTHYRHETLSVVFYSMNLVTASLFHLFKLIYAWRKKFIKVHVTTKEYRNAKLRIIIPIIIYLSAIPVSFLLPSFAIFLFFIPIGIHLIPESLNESANT